ncbi:MAG: copper-binding protein [Burkholderiales bacterium]|nr:copper-binding protein [Burkholderiales bacterium]
MNMPFHTVLMAALTVTFLAAPVLAQTDHSMHGSPAAKPTAANSAMQEGVVKKIDKPAGKVALAHGAQKDGMPAMTMVYRVKDASWLDKLQVGQKVRFATDAADSMSVVRLELLK